MPLFVAAVAARRCRRPATVTVRVGTPPPLWQMIVEEVAIAVRGVGARVFGRRDRHHGATRSPQ